VDEASQVTLPVCLGPLQYADVFVLVGDHYQLPPLVRAEQHAVTWGANRTNDYTFFIPFFDAWWQVRNIEARDRGFDVSLFRQLSEAHPAATVTLSQQYRMNAELMALANVLTYGMTVCGFVAYRQHAYL